MPQYLTPGVYVEEVPGTPPITGVGTSTAGFIGTVDPKLKNPDNAAFLMPLKPGSDSERYGLAGLNEPHLVTNWEQFKSKFGDFHTANSTLAHAVFGFFNNGGATCWIVRVETLADTAGVQAALKRFEAIDEIALVAAPGALDVAVQEAIISHCEGMKDRFAILDGQPAAEISATAIKGTVRNSDYAALYFPQVQVFDPVTAKPSFVPPSGHIAGLFSRVDLERGVHKAPANETLRGVIGLAYPISPNEQSLLNPAGINVIRNFNGTILVWGARTLGGGDPKPEFRYINVRRLMNFLRESIEDGTRFAVFEPNAAPLWQRIRRSVSAFLTNVWRDGALFGETPDQAFYVKCDESTNPADVREAGQVVTEIGVAIVKPAEFVIFRIAQMTGSVS
jgi:hypothetical protein